MKMEKTDITEYVKELCASAKEASRVLSSLRTEKKNEILRAIKTELENNKSDILEANKKDVQRARGVLTESKLDRLSLDEGRIDGILEGVESLISLPDPTGSGERFTRPNGLVINKVRVPLGVVAMIYEARPNVTVDSAALCLKTGNAVVLRGGKEAIETNRIFVSLIREALEKTGIDKNAVSLIDSTEREATNVLMTMRGLVDVLIPRGSAALIKAVVENSTVPTIETGAGNCHLYVDESADIDMALDIAINAKLSRPAVCNAIETLLVHKNAADAFLPLFAEKTKDRLEIRGCEDTCKIIDCAPATSEDYATEYDDCILAIRVVDSIEEAISHIRKYSTGHSEAIVTKDLENAALFCASLDSAAVYVNASTRFTDGGEFGFGAEIGISTQKLHSRGPMGAQALTTVKYLIEGTGQIR